MAAGDISPAPGSSKDDDVATSDLVLDANPTAVLTLGDHQYPRGQLAGVRAFTVGTGGNSLYRFSTPPRSTSRYRDDGHYGVLHLTLSPTSWRSQFRRTDGRVADQAAAGCWR
jgi:hypothetical protein